MGDPVVFPNGSPQNAVIRSFTRKLPPGVRPKTKTPHDIGIRIPDSASKPVAQFNDIGERGCRAVAAAIKDLFIRQLWADLSPLTSAPVSLNTLLYAWCENNGISLDGVEAVRQCYNRIRHSYLKRGINLKIQKKYDKK